MTLEHTATISRRWRRPVMALALGASVAGAGLATGASPAFAAAPKVIVASLTEFHITLSRSTFSPGSYTFVAKNNGKIVHALAITGPGANKRTGSLSPGQSAKLTVTFKKGSTYDVFCPVPGHKALGMNVNVRVKEAGGAVTSSVSGSSSSTSLGGMSGGS
jgi:plastocyanin